MLGKGRVRAADLEVCGRVGEEFGLGAVEAVSRDLDDRTGLRRLGWTAIIIALAGLVVGVPVLAVTGALLALVIAAISCAAMLLLSWPVIAIGRQFAGVSGRTCLYSGGLARIRRGEPEPTVLRWADIESVKMEHSPATATSLVTRIGFQLRGRKGEVSHVYLSPGDLPNGILLADVIAHAARHHGVRAEGYNPSWPAWRSQGGAVAMITGVIVILAAAAAFTGLVLFSPPGSSLSLAATLTGPVPADEADSQQEVAFSPDGATLAATDGDSNAFLWDVATRRVISAIPGAGDVTSQAMAFSPDGATLATLGSDGNVSLLRVATHTVIGTLPGLLPSGWADFTVIAFSPNGATVATGDDAGDALLWDAATRKVIATLSPGTSPGDGTSPVQAIAFSPDGTTLAVQGEDGTTYLWDVATRRMTATLAEPAGASSGMFISAGNTVAFSPDGKLLVTVGTSGEAYLRSTATLRVIATLADPSTLQGEGAQAVAFSPDGKTVATVDSDGNAYLWDTATRRLAGTVTDPGSGDHPGVVSAMAFSPDGKLLATGDVYGQVFLWHLPPGSA
jgi:WD40 repeat protein